MGTYQIKLDCGYTQHVPCSLRFHMYKIFYKFKNNSEKVKLYIMLTLLWGMHTLGGCLWNADALWWVCAPSWCHSGLAWSWATAALFFRAPVLQCPADPTWRATFIPVTCPARTGVGAWCLTPCHIQALWPWASHELHGPSLFSPTWLMAQEQSLCVFSEINFYEQEWDLRWS